MRAESPFLLAVRSACSIFFCAALGCSESAPECVAVPRECQGAAPSYALDVAPIFSARCGGCHNRSDPSGPWPFDEREDVADWSAQVLRALESCSMPPPGSGMPLPDAERKLLANWLRCGAPDN